MKNKLLLSISNKAFIGWLFLVMLSACSPQTETQGPLTDKEFLLKGTVKNLADGATIHLMTIGETRYETLDSAKVKNGAFSFRGVPDESKLYVLNFGDKTRVPIFLNTGEITVDADLSDPRNEPTVTGSPYTSQLQAFNNLTRRLENVLYEMEAEYAQLAQAGKQKEMQEHGNLIEKTAQSQLTYYKNFIDSIGISPVVGHILAVFNPETDFEYMDSMLTKLKNDSPQSDHVKRIDALLSKYRTLRIGQLAPEISLTFSQGTNTTLSQLKGKWVLIDFWASWCKPCRAESPRMVKLYDRYKNKSFEILGVALDNQEDAWKNAIANDRYTWPQISDLKGWQSDAAKLYQVSSIPFTVLVNPEGKIHAKGLRGEQLEQTLASLLK